MKQQHRQANAAFSWGTVVAAAVAGTLAVDTKSSWYRRLRKPSWQPAPKVFPVAWTLLYTATATASTRALNRLDQEDGGAAQYRLTLGTNMALNAAWTALFFRGHALKVSTIEAVVLAASTGILAGRAWKADRVSGALVLPYAAWTSFAAALTATLARKNP